MHPEGRKAGNPGLRRPWLVATLCATAFLLSACGDRAPTKTTAAPFFLPQGFADLPLPELVGYETDPDRAPIVVSSGFGALRRFDVVFTPRSAVRGESPETVISRLNAAMARLGWERLPGNPQAAPDAPARPNTAWFRKSDEISSIFAVADGEGSRLRMTVHTVRPTSDSKAKTGE
jgi:hypothetical protein